MARTAALQHPEVQGEASTMGGGGCSPFILCTAGFSAAAAPHCQGTGAGVTPFTKQCPCAGS